MGYILEVKCSACNYSTKVNYGCTRVDFSSSIPALNTITNVVETLRLDLAIDEQNGTLKDDFKHYKPYSDKLLQLNNGSTPMIGNELNKSDNYCPKCKEFTLCFSVVGLTD